MTTTETPSSARADTLPNRLTSWKEIARHLGRSVRTVQRWEREASLPVHRYPTRGGEGVFAFREELDVWTRTTTPSPNGDSLDGGNGSGGRGAEPQPGPGGREAAGTPERAPGPPRSRWHRGLVSGAVFLTALALIAWFAWPVGSPASWRVDHDKLIAFDSAGTLLWTSTLPYAVNGATYEESERTKATRSILGEDLDGDGDRELVITTYDGTSGYADLLCFDAKGHERWRRRPERTALFGAGRMTAPWIPLFFVVTREAGTAASLWVSWANRPDFGAFVERLDIATGKPLAVYWSAGHVTSVAMATIDGRPALLVGAANNEHKAASLAVFDLSLAQGSAPAADPRYACLDCPTDRPRAFFVFPKTILGREVHAETAATWVDAIMQDAAGQVTVVVQQGPAPRGGPDSAHVLYRFDSHFRLQGGELGDDYRLLHRRLEREGRLAFPVTVEEERGLFPVLSWKDGSFVSVAGPVQNR